MKRLFTSLLLLLLHYTLLAAPAPKISYTVSPLKAGDHQTFLIEMNLKGSATGTTALTLPYETGLYCPQGQLTLLGVANSRKHYRAAEDSSRYLIEHKPGATLTIRYTVTNALKDTVPTINEVYAPMLTANYFYVIGSSLWIVPHDTTGARYDISLAWKGFPAQWSYLNSYGAHQVTQTIQTPIPEFLQAIYTGGDLRIHRLDINNKPLYFGIRGQWSFSDEQILEVIRKTVSAQRAYWNDYSAEHYTVALIPMKHNTADDRELNGRGLTNTFVSVGTNTKALGLDDLTYLYNHEFMHHWLGHVLQQRQPENAYKWFHEGFTDYFAYMIMRESGLLDGEGFRRRVNEIFTAYYSDSTNQWPNEKIEKDYWASANMQKLPYQRGLVFALYLDESIRFYSKGQSTLKDIIAQMLTEKAPLPRTFSPERFCHLLHGATGRDYSPEIDRFITAGTFISAADWQAVTTRVTLLPGAVFDLGFTTDRGIALNAVVTSVADGSNVQKAGLRVGDVMVGFSSTMRTTETATLTVKRGEEKIRFQYLPVGKIWVPQLK